MLKEIDNTITDLPINYDTLEERYFQVFKLVHGNLNMTIEEFRGSNIYNIFNTCILVDMVNNQFLTNFIPNIVDNSITQNEIQTIKYSGNTSFYLKEQLKKIDNINNVQIIDVNSDSIRTPKGNIRIFLDTTGELIDQIIGETIYHYLNEGVISLGDVQININRDGFIKNIQWSESVKQNVSLIVTAFPNNEWQGDLFTNQQLIQKIYDEWNNYYDFQKQIQPQVFLRNLEMLANVSFEFSYKNNTYTEDFVVENGDYLILDIESIQLNMGGIL